MQGTLFSAIKFLIPLFLVFVFASCDPDCRDGECPSEGFFLNIEVTDSLGRNCFDINPDLEEILLSSNELNQNEFVVLRTGRLLLMLDPDIEEYHLKYSQSDTVTFLLTGETMDVFCCDNEPIEVFLDYQLTNKNTNQVIPSDFFIFKLIIPSCD